MFLIEIIIGVILAVLVFYPYRNLKPKTLKKFFARTLFIAAVIYVGFAIFGLIFGTADIFWLLIEFGGVLIFTVVAYFGFKKTALFLAIGWATHVLWDVGLHLGDKAEFVPWFYPGVCVGFDLAFAVFIIHKFFIAEKT